MKTKTMLLVVSLAVLLVAAAAPARSPNAGPAEKATGDVQIAPAGEPNFPDGKARYFEFNAHEAKGRRPAKGRVHWWLMDTEGNIEREIWVDVKYVLVVDKKAWFSGECVNDTADANVGRWLALGVHDMATPGAKGDTLWVQWYDYESDAAAFVASRSTDGQLRDVIEGNLVVHTYD